MLLIVNVINELTFRIKNCIILVNTKCSKSIDFLTKNEKIEVLKKSDTDTE
jgi:hypothetical protein